jgi:hypothetical protein
MFSGNASKSISNKHFEAHLDSCEFVNSWRFKKIFKNQEFHGYNFSPNVQKKDF